jgi:hypothetical protein
MSKQTRQHPMLRYRTGGLHGETIVNEKREVRIKASGKYWHRVLPDGSPVFRCKCAEKEHNVTWKDLQDIAAILAQHPGERWNLICDGQAMVLARPGAQHKGRPFNTRLVSFAFDPTHVLVAYDEEAPNAVS